MGKYYRQVSKLDRELITQMLLQGFSKAKIAQNLGFHRSTIYREVKRNGYSKPLDSSCGLIQYVAFSAERRRLERCKRRLKLNFDKDLRKYVETKLKQHWSPWQIEGRLKLENQGRCIISHETIYRYIYSDYGIRNQFYIKLRRKHFLRMKHHSRKPRIPPELLIHNRPDLINNREEFGHWECDLMIFKRGIKANLITLRERTTRYLIALKNQDKTASGTAIRLISMVKKLKPHIKSITFDQGSEFQQYTWIKQKLGADIYFCQPASPHQKGAVENANSLLRIALPRKTDIARLSQKQITNLAQQINSRPLRCLDYRTAEECFSAIC
jgi:transposase, IS30 family